MTKDKIKDLCELYASYFRKISSREQTLSYDEMSPYAYIKKRITIDISDYDKFMKYHCDWVGYNSMPNHDKDIKVEDFIYNKWLNKQ